MDKNQLKKKLSLIGNHISYRLSPTKPSTIQTLNQTLNSETNQSNLIQSNDLTLDRLNNNVTKSFDSVVLVERVIKDFKNAFDKDSNILEFSILEVNEKLENKSPVILIDHNIALEKWCIEALYKYLYKQLLKYKKKELWLNEEDLKQRTRLMLFLNPDVPFVWNIRKTLVEDRLLSAEEDLNVSYLVLKIKPKNQANLAHREWLLMYLHKRQQLTPEILNRELEICLEAANQYASNYNAWNHRYYIVNKFFSSNLHFLLGENELIKKWINSHISDYCGYHYKQMILSIIFYLVKDKEKIVELLNCENANSKKLIQIYPNQEALFCHKRYLLKLKHLQVGLDANDVKEEREFVKQSYKLAKRFENNWLIMLTNRYIKWIEYNCKIQIDVN